ncbi:MAG: PucR family transcriptional regulator, partial [Solirubrobacterales bacterium]|nr:PucR family transcriptional regulator [Solirubrobacterales bacterium]
MSSAHRWERPSDRTCELIRTGAELLLAAPDAGLAQVDAVTLADVAPAIREDPGLVASIRRANRANLTHWLEANRHDPGMPVEPNLGPDTFGIARDLVRRGLDQNSLDAYRTGQNAAWRAWMAVAFTLTSDPGELAELLDVSARSVFGFVDETLAGIAVEVEREREHLTRGTQAERLEVVSLVLGGAPITAERAGRRLGYDLGQTHTAAIVFSDAADADPVALEEAAEALARHAGARRPLTVVASESALWTWIASGLDVHALPDALHGSGQVRVALGPTLPGIEGFRRSHR